MKSKLAGVYSIGEKTIIARMEGNYPSVFFYFYELKKEGGEIKENHIITRHPKTRVLDEAFVTGFPDLGHMLLPQELRGRGLALKIASKAERQVRAKKQGATGLIFQK